MFPPLSKVCRKSIFHPNYEEEGCYQTSATLAHVVTKGFFYTPAVASPSFRVQCMQK